MVYLQIFIEVVGKVLNLLKKVCNMLDTENLKKYIT
jgi:hypothetical protein